MRALREMLARRRAVVPFWRTGKSGPVWQRLRRRPRTDPETSGGPPCGRRWRLPIRHWGRA